MPILVVGFGGEYCFGHRGNPDAVFMKGVVELGKALFNPFGVVLDLRGLDYRWGDQISKPIMSACGERGPCA